MDQAIFVPLTKQATNPGTFFSAINDVIDESIDRLLATRWASPSLLIVKAVNLSYHKQTYSSHYELLEAIVKQVGNTPNLTVDIADLSPGNVLKPDGELNLVRVGNSRAAANAFQT